MKDKKNEPDPPVVNWTYPDGETELVHLVETKAYPPKVKIENEIFPAPHEVYNCTNCRKGRQLPGDRFNKEEYVYYCSWDMKTHIGPRWNDTGCKYFDRKIRKEMM